MSVSETQSCCRSVHTNTSATAQGMNILTLPPLELELELERVPPLPHTAHHH